MWHPTPELCLKLLHLKVKGFTAGLWQTPWLGYCCLSPFSRISWSLLVSPTTFSIPDTQQTLKADFLPPALHGGLVSLITIRTLWLLSTAPLSYCSLTSFSVLSGFGTKASTISWIRVEMVSYLLVGLLRLQGHLLLLWVRCVDGWAVLSPTVIPLWHTC